MPKTTVFRLWTHGFPRHGVDHFGNEADTMMTVDVHDAEDYWGPCITIGRDDLDIFADDDEATEAHDKHCRCGAGAGKPIQRCHYCALPIVGSRISADIKDERAFCSLACANAPLSTCCSTAVVFSCGSARCGCDSICSECSQMQVVR